MVVRRIREHVTTQNWFAVGIDLVIVVVGVFLGTQVNNWNEERLNRDRAADYRSRLVEELDFNARQYALQHAYYRQAKAYGLQALDDLAGRTPLEDNDFLIAAYQLTQMDTTRAKTGVYDEMKGSGLVDRLGDPETQAVASDFYLTVEVAQRSVEATFPYRTLLREAMPYPVQSRIRDACGDRNVFYQKRLVGIRLVVPCMLIIDPVEVATATKSVRAIPDLERQMTRYVASLDEKLVNLALGAQQARDFRNRLLGDPLPGST
ncbi:MAG: hypothetical protein V4696_14265 [Pseudomonadota bacterium]